MAGLRLLLAAVAITATGLALAAPAQAFTAKERKQLTAIVEKGMVEKRQPGLAVGIWIPQRGTYVRAFGVADRRTGRKLRLSDRFRIASITKTFTATAVLRLVDQGKLSLDDKLESYIPGIENGDTITIRNLLGMTSGLFDYTTDQQFGDAFNANPLMPFDLDDVIAIVKRHQPSFAPGEKVEYCDTNYYFLGAILEQVTGDRLGQVIEDQIIDPLKLTHTTYPTSPALPVPFSHGYYAGPEGKGHFRDVTRVNPAVAAGAGAMISTVADLHTWVKALATGTLLSPALHAAQTQFGTIPNPGGVSVGYGLGLFDFDGLLGHNGAIYGYSSAMFYLPDADATIVVEGNQSSNFLTATTDIVFALVEYLFPERFAAT